MNIKKRTSMHAEASIHRKLILFAAQMEGDLAHFPNCHKYTLTRMTSIYAYRKHFTPHTVITMSLPDSQGEEGELYCTELCTLGDTTYVAVPAGVELPEQPAEIEPQLVELTPELREQIKAASPHAQLIAERMELKIREKYSVNDEAYFARIGVGVALGSYTFEPGEQEALLEFGAYVESVRAWGRAERAKLGL